MMKVRMCTLLLVSVAPLFVGAAHGAGGLSTPRRILSADNSADQEDLRGNKTWEIETDVEQIFGNASQFRTRYFATVSCDVGTAQEGPPFSGQKIKARHRYTMAFSVATAGTYEVRVAQERAGQLDVEYDSDCSKGEVLLSPIQGNYSGDGTLDGSLTLGSQEKCISGPGTCFGGADCHQPFHDSASAVIRGISNGTVTSHSLTFSWTSAVSCEWSSKEAVVRFGRQTDDKTNDAAHYPGNGGRDETADGHIVTVTLLAHCGDGNRDTSRGEQCDDGMRNGAAGGGCTVDCRIPR